MKTEDIALYGLAAFGMYYFFIKPKAPGAVAIHPIVNPGTGLATNYPISTGSSGINAGQLITAGSALLPGIIKIFGGGSNTTPVNNNTGGSYSGSYDSHPQDTGTEYFDTPSNNYASNYDSSPYDDGSSYFADVQPVYDSPETDYSMDLYSIAPKTDAQAMWQNGTYPGGPNSLVKGSFISGFICEEIFG